MKAPDISNIIEDLSSIELAELYAGFVDYEEEPVDIERFLDDPRYLGGYFQGTLYEYWRQELRRIFPSPHYSTSWLVALRGSIGTGKTTTACAGLAYDTYRLLCLAKPQSYYGLIESTKIIFSILTSQRTWHQMSSGGICSKCSRRAHISLGSCGIFGTSAAMKRFSQRTSTSRSARALGIR